MSFLGGAGCSAAGNPLTQFTKHVQNDTSLQRDRLVGRSLGGLQEGMRSQSIMVGQDQMMDEFLQQEDQIPPAATHPFSMEQMRLELENFQAGPPRTGSSGWAAEFDTVKNARMDPAFPGPKSQLMQGIGFSAKEFAHFSHQSSPQRTASPVTSTPAVLSSYHPQRGMGYRGVGGNYMPMMGSSYGHMAIHQQSSAQEDKGKGRMVELDDKNWEAQFAEIDAAGEKALDEEATAAMEAELDDLDRSVPAETDEFGHFESIWNGIQAETAERRRMVNEEVNFENMHLGEFGEWDNFDGSLNTHSFRDPQLGDYLFEEENSYRLIPNPFEEGIRMMREGDNLSLAVLAFEAAVQKDPKHVEAWTMLGSAQAQNEKESPAIRAYEQALKLDPSNLDARMGLAVSYTNEGYDSTAYRTLEIWLSVKYPQIINPKDITPDTEMGFTDRHLLQEKPSSLRRGEHMDPDVQVGLGVLFYGAEEYDKAVDCFSAALASNESGTSNQQEQLHLLWNRLGATLANSGRSEEAIEAYEKALTIRPNFVRARYNLGVSCINIGCYPEAAQHLLGALAMHQAVDRGESFPFSEDEIADSHSTHNQSTNLYDTLRRVFNQMGRRDLSDMVVNGMDVEVFRKEFTF
uniref:Peroxisomal targeting signal receptor n=1 Tax=Coccidioides posadasii RMSCC 3488 TaxID=454284 RepID=A0A0J6FLN1_COCPO|nr:peroxisomal targeting signal receptor [Coccidioides posadasii RMSCC 3488]